MFTFDYRDVSFAHKVGFSSSPKDEFDKHMHHFYELIYFVRGEVDFHVEGISSPVNPGDVVLIQPGQFHFAEVNRSREYERYVCKVPEEILPPYLRERMVRLKPFFVHCEGLLPILNDLDSYAEEFLESEEDMRALCCARLTELFIRLCKEENANIEETKNSVAHDLVNYIETHLGEKLTLESLADAFHYSTSYIATSFRREMHVSIISYVRGKKIMAAHAMILHGVKPSDAATMMGFSDYSTFFRSYQKMLGVSPSAGRKSSQSPGGGEE